MEAASNIESNIEKRLREEVWFETKVWPPVLAISGGLGLLLSTYLRTTTLLIHVHTDTPEQQWDASITVDQEHSAHEFLENLGKYYQQKTTDLIELKAFKLRTETPQTWKTIDDKSSDSQNSTIPSEIRCTVRESQASYSLELEVTGRNSSANKRFLHQLTHITKQLLVAAGCGSTLRDLDLICDLDREDLERWNRQPLSTLESTIHETFAQRLIESPESPAVEAWDGKLTYQELDDLSSRVCILLLQAGVHQGDCIPLCFEKSLWTVVAMLGVLKCGCSFLLMDISHPTSRLQTLSKEARATIVLSSSAQADRAISLAPRAIVISASLPSERVENEQLRIAANPSDVAVVVFTSGTTGTPKGIQIEHKSVLSSLWALSELSNIGRHTRYFQFSSYAFDAGFGDIIMTLMRGGCVCVPSEADRLNNLAESIRTFNANAVLFTPSVLRLLSPSDVSCFKTIICGGEKVTQDLVRLWSDKVDLVIVYGPAETTVACIAKKALPAADDTIRIGFPLNSRAWVARLDDPDKLAPVGAIGEMVAEGPGIARGYINKESSNSEAFLSFPPWKQEWESSVLSMGRTYRTGDLVRYADDGELVFVGRRDRQVKLRGQRIELEDIELKLKQHIELSEVNVFLEVLNVLGTDNLVAFIHHPTIRGIPGNDIVNSCTTQLPGEILLEIEGLHRCIAEVLPAYMWPVAWIPLTVVPLGPTGKLDRRKLLSLGKDFYSKLRTDEEEDKGLSSIESVLAQMWRQLLPSVHSLTPDTNFFHLGGDSLRCMRLVTMVNEKGFHLTMQKVFNSPTISGMATAMQEIPAAAANDTNKSHLQVAATSHSATQDEILKMQSSLDEYGIRSEEVESVFPCTSLQSGLFSLSLAMPSLYSSQFVFDCRITVDTKKFKAAWESAISTFHILRTAIVPSSDRLVQVVLQNHAQWTEVTQDLASFLATDKMVSFQPGQLLNRHYHVQDPSSGQSYFVWTLHHAVFDGWSLDTVVDHIRQNYSSPAENMAPTGSFQGFVRFCEGLNLDESTLFWKEQLENAPIPSFPNFPKVGHLAADRSCLQHTMAAPAGAATTITILARASWALLLSEYENSDDVTFGNSLHGRNSLPPELQDVVGPTIATLPIRVRININETIYDFLEGLQAQFSAMIPHEQFGLSKILDINQNIRNAASFRTLLIIQVADAKFSDNQDIRLNEVERSLHEYPLVLTLMPGKSNIELSATFDSDVISSSQVQRILEQFEQIFQELAVVPRDAKVNDLDLASKADKSVMFAWNARYHKAYEVCVHDLIRERVKHSRASPAIHSKDGTIDYATLDRLSDGIAGELIRAGVRPGNTVGVLFEKSQWAIVSTLAVIKAGASFAPFSPTYPLARLEGIVKDAGIKIVLCSSLQESAFHNAPWRTITISDETASSFTPAAQLQMKKVTPDSLLYILSTSGTTGTPKIFGVQHKSFATGAMARAPLLNRGPDSRVLQFAPYAFDPSVEDILTTLMFGGCICVPSEDDIMGDISAFMKTARVNFANITPSVAHTLKQDELPDLKILLLSGEAPDQPLVDKWHGIVQLMNGYGPSECSVKCAINRNLSRNDPRNIGFSAGTSLWVVKPDNHNRLTPLGAVGELVIESPHLATGYLNRPEANEEKFILSPPWLQDFRDGQITRIYKTGDLVRYNEDGSIGYIGRGDMQLKLHGQRLEGEEVRQRIQECLCDAQLQVIVDIARFEGQDSDVLVAYLARKKDDQDSGIELDRRLQQHLAGMKEHMVRQISAALPRYMIPSVFLAVTRIPLTGNGKTDRRALKAFAARHRLGPHLTLSERISVQLPATETERMLHNLWQQLFGLESDQFGTNSNFFELGGSFLTAIKLASAARALGHNLTAQIIFRNPVLSSMAIHVVPLQETQTVGPSKFGLLEKVGRSVYQLKKSLEAHDISDHNVEDAYPLTRQQQRYMEGEMMSSGGTTHRHIMQLPNNIDLERLETTLRRVVKANALLRTRVISVSSQLVQVVLKEDFICRHVESLSSLISEDRKVSWGLGQQLSRFSIVHEKQTHYRWLVWSSAHVIFDGWSRKLLLDDIDYVYHHDDSPPERPQYSRFIEYVYDLEKDNPSFDLITKLENTNFWSYYTLDGSKAPGSTRVLSLAIDLPGSLPPQLSYPTVMLTAWALAASHIEDYDHFLFNILLGGRDAALTGIDKLMGPVSTTAPLATNIDYSSTFLENIEFIQKQVDEAGDIKHFVRFSDKVRRLLASAPIVVVHPGDDYEEAVTAHLGMSRRRVEPVNRFADAMFMNFCLRPRNVGVDLIMAVDPSFFPVDKATRYLGYLEHILKRVFAPGGMGLTVKEMQLASAVLTKSVAIKHRD